MAPPTAASRLNGILLWLFKTVVLLCGLLVAAVFFALCFFSPALQDLFHSKTTDQTSRDATPDTHTANATGLSTPEPNRRRSSRGSNQRGTSQPALPAAERSSSSLAKLFMPGRYPSPGLLGSPAADLESPSSNRRRSSGRKAANITRTVDVAGPSAAESVPPSPSPMIGHRSQSPSAGPSTEVHTSRSTPTTNGQRPSLTSASSSRSGNSKNVSFDTNRPSSARSGKSRAMDDSPHGTSPQDEQDEQSYFMNSLTPQTSANSGAGTPSSNSSRSSSKVGYETIKFEECLEENDILEEVDETDLPPIGTWNLLDGRHIRAKADPMSFEEFKERARICGNEADFKALIEAALEKWGLEFSREVVFSTTHPSLDRHDRIKRGKPDFMNKDNATRVRSHLKHTRNQSVFHYLRPNSKHPLCLPNFFIEAKGPRGAEEHVVRQALYNGALGARAIHKVRECFTRRSEHLFDNVPRTMSITMHDAGPVVFYISRPRQAEGAQSGAEPGYRLRRIGGFNIRNGEDHLKWQIAVVRAYEWAKQTRDHVLSNSGGHCGIPALGNLVHPGESPSEAQETSVTGNAEQASRRRSSLANTSTNGTAPASQNEEEDNFFTPREADPELSDSEQEEAGEGEAGDTSREEEEDDDDDHDVGLEAEVQERVVIVIEDSDEGEGSAEESPCGSRNTRRGVLQVPAASAIRGVSMGSPAARRTRVAPVAA